MTRILTRLIFSYIIFGLFRAVERRYGVLGVLALAGFVLLPLAAVRFLPLLARLGI